MNNKTKHYHFIGIGGIGMSGLAEILIRQGHVVSGSDLSPNPLTKRLEDLGVRFYRGHRAKNLQGAPTVVVSAAIAGDNPEMAAAQEQGLEVISRAGMLARLMEGKTRIAIAGAHGKTTTTSMVASILRQGGLDPTVVVGAVVENLGSNAIVGQGDCFVAEADESDGSFLALNPHVAVITNIDREHMDHYRDLAHIQEIFARFIEQVHPEGVVVACKDDPNLAPLLSRSSRKVVSYSMKPGGDFWAADFHIQNSSSRYRLMRGEQELGQVSLPLAGRHYVANSLAAAAVGFSLGLDFPAIQKGLAKLGQIQRRLQIKGDSGGVTIIDDYGHHPTEIKVTLEAISQSFRGRRVLVAFQPHRYSRTQALLTDFYQVFQPADVLFLTEIYGAGEAMIPGITGRCLFNGVRQSGQRQVYYVEDKKELAAKLWDAIHPGDVVVTMGAGDIWKIGEEVLRFLESGGSRPHSVLNISPALSEKVC
jgi:UDP-N-acetylmuramate--alanine ligase